MSATMARQGGQVQLAQSDMRLALNMAKMANGGFARAVIEETQHLIKKPCAKVREEKKRCVEFPGHRQLKAAIERHPAMVYYNHTDGCLPYHNCTADCPQTQWSRKGTGAPPPGTPSPPGTPPAPPGATDKKENYRIEGMPSRCVYIHSSHPDTQFFNHNAFAKDCKCDEDFVPDLLFTLSAAQ